jgi:hypothetical protein
MRASAVLLGALFALGCSRTANKKLDEIADRACACQDAECARKIGEDLAAWGKQYTGAEGDQEQAAKSYERLLGCLNKVGGAKKAMERAFDKKAGKTEASGEGAEERERERERDKAGDGDKDKDKDDKPADK